MFIFGNLLSALATVLHYALTVYMWVVIIRALLSWVNPDPFNPLVQFLHRLTEPVLYPVRRRLNPLAMGIDLSPLVVFLVIIFLDRFVVASLDQMALRLR